MYKMRCRQQSNVFSHFVKILRKSSGDHKSAGRLFHVTEPWTAKLPPSKAALFVEHTVHHYQVDLRIQNPA